MTSLKVDIIEQGLENPLPLMGTFDTVISCFAIHHLNNKKKYTLYKELFDVVSNRRIFYNLDNASSPSPGHHIQFLGNLY